MTSEQVRNMQCLVHRKPTAGTKWDVAMNKQHKWKTLEEKLISDREHLQKTRQLSVQGAGLTGQGKFHSSL